MKLSYSLNSIRTSDLLKSCCEIMNHGFSGVELCFDKEQFNPFLMTDDDIISLKKSLIKNGINPVAISTATTFFLSEIPHEPSVISINEEDRKKRISVVKKGINFARTLGIPIVSFQSGYLRNYHENMSRDEVEAQLICSIENILLSIRNDDDITLVIEPEPGMFIETLEDAKKLINKINNSRFRLHIDICHTFCTEDNYIDSIKNYIDLASYVHLADVRAGYNLKFSSVNSDKDISIKNNGRDGCLYHIKNENNFILILDGKIVPHDFICDSECGDNILRENRAYLDSVELVSEEVKNLAMPILNNIRQLGLVDKPLCNTLQGKVHYHDFPGSGDIDFESVIKILNEKYHNYITVELYNHAKEWKDILPNSFKFLTNLKNKINLQSSFYIGEIDHRTVDAPYVRLATANYGVNGDVGCMYDLRFSQPNSEQYISPMLMHSMEHSLLSYFKNKYRNNFLCLAPMGCQTGFYLVLLNETNIKNIGEDLINALLEIKEFDLVPYANDKDCGQSMYHDLNELKYFAKNFLESIIDLSKVKK